jgi:type IV secretion system protein VirD4
MIKSTTQIAIGGIAGAFVGLLLGGVYLNFMLGHPIEGSDPLLLVTEFPTFAALFERPYSIAYMILGVSTLLFAGAAAIFVLTLKLTQYGQARFQTNAEIKKGGLMAPVGQASLFGKTGTPQSRKPYIAARFDDIPHALVCAPTRSGKGVGYVIPNTLTFPGSTFTLDVKGEIFEATARYREKRGDKIFRFAPFDFERGSHRFNPLDRISKMENIEQQYTELEKIASYFLTTSGKGNAEDFLTEGRQFFVAACMRAIEIGKPTIGEATRMILGQENKSAAYKKIAKETDIKVVRRQFSQFAGYDNRGLSSHLSVLSGAGLNKWNNPAVDRVTSGNDFSLTDLRKQPMSIYIVVASDDIPVLAPVIRLMVGELIATLRATEPDPAKEPWTVQIMLDEFDQLGHMPIVVQSLKQLAGHGAKISIITQSIPGLDDIYGENQRLALEANAGMKVYLYANDKKTAAEVSDSLGKKTQLAVSDSLSRDSGFRLRRSVSRRNEERPLMTPDEVRRLDEEKCLILPERRNPILANRIIWYQDPTFIEVYESSLDRPLPFPPDRRDLDAMQVKMREIEGKVAQVEQIIEYQGEKEPTPDLTKSETQTDNGAGSTVAADDFHQDDTQSELNLEANEVEKLQAGKMAQFEKDLSVRE